MKIGILGYGYMGTIRHRELRARTDCEVTRIFHTDPALPGRATRWQDVVDDPAIDAVVVCLPNHLTTEVACAALSAGKHVLAEKPPGTSVADVRRMIAAEDASGRTLQFGFNHRHHPAIRALVALVRAGELGETLWLRGVYGKPPASDFAEGWRADPSLAGGGILLDQGIHMLDLLHMLAGPFDDVRAVMSPAGAAIEHDVMAVMRAGRGALASLHSSQTQSPPRFSLEVGLERGSAVVEGLLTRTGRYGPERIAWGTHDAPRAHEETFAHDDSWAREIEAFLSAARRGSKPELGSTDDALALMLLLERIYAEGGAVRGSR